MLISLGLAFHPSQASLPVGCQEVADAYDLPAEVLIPGRPEGIGPSDRHYRQRSPLVLDAERPGQGALFSSRGEAETALNRFLEQGRTSVDIGPMQVN